MINSKEETPYYNYFTAIYNDILKGVKNNKSSIEKKAASFGVTDKNTVKEITETAIVTIARNIANQPNKTPKQKYNAIVELYNSQVNLSHRTSQSMLLQQYSTPATLAYLMGVYCQIDKTGLFLEPSAGNGMLTIASSGRDFIVNEIDKIRLVNLNFQNIFKKTTRLDSSKKAFDSNLYDAVITNPPFGKLDSDEYLKIDGFTIKELDHKMAILALNAMKSNGRAAIIVGGHTSWDAKGRVQAGKNRTFLSYLYRNYNVEDIININGKKLYTKMGTGFNVRAILIKGRKLKPEGFAPLKQFTNDVSTVDSYDQLYSRISQYYKNTPMDLLRKADALKQKQKELSQGLGSPYIPASEACFTLQVDTPDSMSFEMHDAIKKIKKDVGDNLNHYLIEKLNYKDDIALCKALAAEQIDGVSTAIYNIEKKNQGIIIGDQTGIGKGRQAASIIRYAHENGYTPIFLTEKANLFSDLYRDLENIGSAHLKPFIVNARDGKTNIKNEAGEVIYKAPPKSEQEKVFKNGITPNGYDILVSTYSQFASSKPTVKQGWLKKVSSKAIIIMDESHNASGSSATGAFLKDVVKKSKSTIFLSATFAKRPDNMPIYALKTSIQDANLDDDSLVDAIQNGGVALQEVLASQLVAEGQMIRRERSYEGIEVNYLTLDTKAKAHQEIADSITKIIRDIISFQATYVDDMVGQLDNIAAAENKTVDVTQGTQKAGVDNSPYFSRVFNVINQMLFSIKADEVANRAIMRLEQGKKPVIAFSNTMGAFIDELQEGDVVEADFKEVLKRGLDSVTSYTETDMKGNKEKKYFTPTEMDDEARSVYYTIHREIEKVSTGIAISPIDVIVQKLQEAGYKTAEVTGRKKEVQLSLNKNGTYTGLILNRKKENTNDAFRKFNENEVDVLLINQSGSTGASAHAVPTDKVSEKNIKQRVMIVLQAELNINTEVQKRGRINRTGQIIKPIYDYVSSAIPAEKRLSMMLQKKLKSLDANTTSNQKNSEDLMKSDDFLNKYGDDIVKTWLEENPNMNRLLGNLITEDTKIFENLAHKTSGRVAILPVKEQERFYKAIIEQYQIEIQRLLQRGEYDLEVENMNLEAETLEKNISVVGRNSNSLFGGNTYFEKVEINNLRKPYSATELRKMMKENLKSKDAKEYQRTMLEMYDKYKEGELANIFVNIAEKWQKIEKNITKEKGYKDSNDKIPYIAFRKDEIEKAKIAEIELKQSTFTNQTNAIRRIIAFFNIGRGLKYPIVDYSSGNSQVDAVCIDAGFNTNADNPFSPSNISITIAIADSNRRVDLKASGKFQQELQGIIGSSYYMSSSKADTMLDTWDDTTRASNVNRRIGYIVTGNILQGYAKFDKGKLVSYTLKGGGVQKGILMPMHYSPRDSRNGNDTYANVPILLALKFIRSSNGTIRTNTNVELQRQNGNTRVIVPASKKQGGKYFLDKSILKLVEGNNFDKIGSKMSTYVSDDNLEPFLKILQDQHSVSALVMRSRLDEIEAVKEVIDLAIKKEPTVKTDKSKILRLRANAIKIKQKQVMLNLKLKSVA